MAVPIKGDTIESCLPAVFWINFPFDCLSLLPVLAQSILVPYDRDDS